MNQHNGKEKIMNRTILIILLLLFPVSKGYAGETALTVYNNDLAIVKIIDEMCFDKGEQVISFTDVTERIDPTSVRFSAKNGNVSILEQNFRYDLVNSQKVLERYIDKKITIRVKEGEIVEGVIQSVKGDVLKELNGLAPVQSQSPTKIDPISEFIETK